MLAAFMPIWAYFVAIGVAIIAVGFAIKVYWRGGPD